MDTSVYGALEATGAVTITIFLVSAIKKAGVNAKMLPLLSPIIGTGVVWIGSNAGLMAIQDWSIVWYGIVTGIMATGGWSSVKNVLEGIRNE